MRFLLPNAGPRGPMDDDQRKAMFAHMRGGGRGGFGGGGGHSGWPDSGPDSNGDHTATMNDGTVLRSKSREGLDQAIELHRDAQGIQTADSDFLALLPAGKLAMTSKLGEAVASWKTTLGALGISAGIQEVRDRNPTMNPKAEKALALAQQIANYVAAISGLAQARPYGKKLLDAKPVAAATKALGQMLEGIGSKTFAKLPAEVQAALSKAHNLYTTVADFTGSSIKDVMDNPLSTKSAYVAAGFAAKLGTEEYQIGKLQKQMEDAWAEGKSFTVEPDQPRSPLETAIAMAVGTLGNPLEKQFRFGERMQQADTANYRAQYDAIQKAVARGEKTPSEGQAMLEDLAATAKPMNMAGKAAWTFAPAGAAYLSWKGTDYAKRVGATDQVGVVDKVLDADTVHLKGRPPEETVRFLGINAPEIAHPEHGKPTAEYYGPEAAAWQTQQLLGKTVRLVQTQDKNRGPLVGKDIYGQRDLRYVETLPGPLDKALAIPVVGKLIPSALTTDQNLKTIQQGYALPKQAHEKLVGGKHDRRYEYDAAAGEAQKAGVGLNQPHDASIPSVPVYKTFAQRAVEKGNPDPTPSAFQQATSAAGQGLMISGNSGALNRLGQGAGTGVAQGWNAALAVGGALDYNATARKRTAPRVYKPPKKLATRNETEARQLIQDYRNQ